ncbi:Tyrosine-protein phosphatase CpsB [Dyadobacter sp. CECT 9275]|uniref:protein-tyrosine-phosphatase n=1 Tax=Dyadobacter helix TaxID=2822344 RepID=A0A916NMP8_9BACT|nr:CpsB/CapC family capsule biosynthesis tyrosine phosphatase [Dyadobacter sp. CECT 9275]CAG5007926.1 Tyrosine-protein phosphatase CpsB [Dyadobacter sp. CECT 9275]
MLSAVGTDLHIHLLPGIDDGSASVQESMEILTRHYASGIRRIIATPHIRSDFFLNSRQTILPAFEKIRAEANIRYPDLSLGYAAEYFADDYFVMLLETDDLLPLFDEYVLVETSMRTEQPYFRDILRLMIDKGWKPVIAHPERYRPWWSNRKIYDELFEMGVIFQVNLLSLAGKYGPREQEMAELLIQQGKIKAIGSDLHRTVQYDDILKATQNPYFSELSSQPLLNRNEI